MLERLCNAFGPPGMEDDVLHIIKEQLDPFHHLTIHEDAVGNLIVKKPGTGVDVTLIAHADEAGLFIKKINDNGLLSFDAATIVPTVLIGKRVSIGSQGNSTDKKCTGVIGYTPIHHQRRIGNLESSVTVKALSIDIGCTKKDAAEAHVSLGDWAVFTTPFREDQGVMMGKALDNRLNVAVLIDLLKDPEIPNAVTAVFSRISKTWMWGSAAAGETYASTYNIALETIAADDGPTYYKVLAGQEIHTTAPESILGAGPAISILDKGHVSSKVMFDHFKKAAFDHSIPYQFKNSSHSMSEVSRFQIGTTGHHALTISLPCRYQNSPCSMAKRSDYEHMIQLLKKGISSLPTL